jgi:magnesium transporter
MTRKRAKKRLAQKAGLPPGTIVATGEPGLPPVGVTQVLYDGERFAERETTAVEEAFPAPGEERTLWINVDGVHCPDLLERVGKRFCLHSLLLEDIAHTGQRPKLENYGEHLFIELNAFRVDPGQEEIATEQISLVLGPTWLLSFNERPQAYARAIRERLRADRLRARHPGPDFLAYSIIDHVVDGYYVVLEHLGDRIEALEEELMVNPTPRTLQAVYGMKREVLHLRKSVWPLREVVAGLQREKDLVRETTSVYLRDLYDHTIQVIDAVETHRDTISGMLDIYLSSVSNRMNEVMKVLTIISTIFIPLTFLAGVYGMNFRHMPELDQPWAYPALWVVMIGIAAGMLHQFRRKNWF